jgi:hypothetical protein
MQRFLFLAFFLLSASAAQAAESKEFIFLRDLLDSLRHCRVAMDYRILGKTPAQKMIEDVGEAKLNLERARQVLEKYMEEEASAINNCAYSVVNAIDTLVYSLDAFSGKLNSVAGLHPFGFEDTVTETARFRMQNRKGWDALCSALSKGLAPIIGRPSKISLEERQKLVERLDALRNEVVPPDLADAPGDEALKEEKRQMVMEFSDALAFIKELLVNESD